MSHLLVQVPQNVVGLILAGLAFALPPCHAEAPPPMLSPFPPPLAPLSEPLKPNLPPAAGPGHASWIFLEERRRGDAWKLLGGAFLGLMLHEAGHLASGYALEARPSVKSVNTGGIPFFAITYAKELNNRQRYAVSAAGFWLQHGSSEAILGAYPDLRSQSAPLLKGAFAFHLLTSLVYAYGALARSGPPERDTLNMAQAQGVDERWIGAAILIPALLDLYRYYHPRSPVAAWTARGFKLGLVLAVTR